jgi:hypothetical protein
MRTLTALPRDRFSILLLLATSSLLLVGACGKDPVEPQPQPFSGILRTFENGATAGPLEDGAGDWQPIAELNARIAPAAPNPFDSKTTITFELSAEDSLRVWSESAPGAFEAEYFRGRLAAGWNAVELSMANRPSNIYRIYLTVYRDGKSYTTYGDVRKE